MNLWCDDWALVTKPDETTMQVKNNNTFAPNSITIDWIDVFWGLP